MPENENKGGRIPRVSDEDILALFRSTTDPVLSTAEVTEQVPIQRRGVYSRLRDLEERGELASKQIGGRNSVWWYIGQEPIQPEERRDTHAERARETREKRGESSGSGSGTSPKKPEEKAHTGDWFPDLKDTLPGSGTNLEGRIQATRDIYEYLKEHGQGQRSDFKDVVNVDETGYTSFNSFYTNCLDNGGVLATLPGVRSPGEGGHTYRYNP